MLEIEPDLGRHVPEGWRLLRPEARDAEAKRGESFQKIAAAQWASLSVLDSHNSALMFQGGTKVRETL